MNDRTESPFKPVSLAEFDALDDNAKLALLREIHPQLAAFLGIGVAQTAAVILAKERAMYGARGAK